jgi:hypothetical protein
LISELDLSRGEPSVISEEDEISDHFSNINYEIKSNSGNVIAHLTLN